LKKSKFTEAQVVGILTQAARDDISVADVCRIHGISENTYYCWKKRYADMGASEVRRLRELEADNARLKRMLAERDLEIDVIKEVMRGK